MPAFHFDRQRLRRTAWATLVVWLIALTTGVVNACVLAPAGLAERASGHLPHADVAVHGLQAGTPVGASHGSHLDHDQTAAHHGHGQGSGKLNCLKFCDGESSAIAKLKLPVVDLGSSPLVAVAPWSVITATGSVDFRPSPERPGSQGPPLVIRFLRLTL